MAIYVLTGGPGVGKSTTLKELVGLGHSVIEETAEKIILEQHLKEHPILPQTDLASFQNLVYEQQIADEKKATGDVIFADRGLHDILAFYRNGGLEIPAPLLDDCRTRDYRKVFLLSPLPTYEQTKVRRETQEQAQGLHKLIEDAYREFGYDVHHVPVLSAKERAEYIVKQVI